MMAKKSWFALVVSLIAAASPAAAQEAGSFRVLLSGGLLTSPASLDVYREVEYDPGLQLAGGIALQLHDNVAFRVDAVRGTNSGLEGGVVDSGVEMVRQYLGASLEASFPLLPSVIPYGLAGMGVVDIERKGEVFYEGAPAYTYSFTEVAILGGAGLRLPLTGGLATFGQIMGWYYPNQAIDETRIDPVFSVGVDFALPF